MHQARWCWHRHDMTVDELHEGLTKYYIPPDGSCGVCNSLPDDLVTCPVCGFLVCGTEECLEGHQAKTCPRRSAVIEASRLGPDDPVVLTRYHQSSCKRSLKDPPDYAFMRVKAASAKENPDVSPHVLMKTDVSSRGLSTPTPSKPATMS